MIAVLQRVNEASVTADGREAGRCGTGLCVLLGVAQGDTERDAEALAEKILGLRIFPDGNDKMNLSVGDVGGQVMVVSNFTLNANYAHGNRPDYFNSAEPSEANRLYEYFLSEIATLVSVCECGIFGADMRTEMSTDGPVTIVMDSSVLLKKG